MDYVCYLSQYNWYRTDSSPNLVTLFSGRETTEVNLSYVVVKFKYKKGIYVFKVFFKCLYVEFLFHWHVEVLLGEDFQLCNPYIFHRVAL